MNAVLSFMSWIWTRADCNAHLHLEIKTINEIHERWKVYIYNAAHNTLTHWVIKRQL